MDIKPPIIVDLQAQLQLSLYCSVWVKSSEIQDHSMVR